MATRPPTATLLRQMKLEIMRASRAVTSSPLLHVQTPVPHTSIIVHTHSNLAIGRRCLNIFSIFSTEAREKERLRLQDEIDRGYFDDIKDIRKHGGKICAASPKLSSKASAQKFPMLHARSPNGDMATIPFRIQSVSEKESHCVVLVCIAFRANAKTMVDSWTVPFIAAFKSTPDVRLFEVSWIDSWFLSLRLVQRLLLLSMHKEVGDGTELIRREVMYVFGDSYEVRKTLGLRNRLSGYVFLLDKEGYIRWQASGMATPEELNFMVSCTSRLMKEYQ